MALILVIAYILAFMALACGEILLPRGQPEVIFNENFVAVVTDDSIPFASNPTGQLFMDEEGVPVASEIKEKKKSSKSHKSAKKSKDENKSKKGKGKKGKGRNEDKKVEPTHMPTKTPIKTPTQSPTKDTEYPSNSPSDMPSSSSQPSSFPTEDYSNDKDLHFNETLHLVIKVDDIAEFSQDDQITLQEVTLKYLQENIGGANSFQLQEFNILSHEIGSETISRGNQDDAVAAERDEGEKEIETLVLKVEIRFTVKEGFARDIEALQTKAANNSTQFSFISNTNCAANWFVKCCASSSINSGRTNQRCQNKGCTQEGCKPKQKGSSSNYQSLTEGDSMEGDDYYIDLIKGTHFNALTPDRAYSTVVEEADPNTIATCSAIHETLLFIQGYFYYGGSGNYYDDDLNIYYDDDWWQYGDDDGAGNETSPSVEPSLSAQPSLSTNPSISSHPSNHPSVSNHPSSSMLPSFAPSVSTEPSSSLVPSFQPSSCDGILIIELKTDSFPGETSIELLHDNRPILNAGNETFTSERTLYRFNVCLTLGEDYVFKVMDSFGDGLCCYYGRGTFSIRIGDDILLDSSSKSIFQKKLSYPFSFVIAPSFEPSYSPKPSPLFRPSNSPSTSSRPSSSGAPTSRSSATTMSPTSHDTMFPTPDPGSFWDSYFEFLKIDYCHEYKKSNCLEIEDIICDDDNSGYYYCRKICANVTFWPTSSPTTAAPTVSSMPTISPTTARPTISSQPSVSPTKSSSPTSVTTYGGPLFQEDCSSCYPHVAADGDTALVFFNDAITFFHLFNDSFEATATVEIEDGVLATDIALSRDVAVIGMFNTIDVTSFVLVFEKTTGQWAETARLIPTPLDLEQVFVGSVDVDGGVIVVHAPGLGNGTVFVYRHVEGTWMEEEVFNTRHTDELSELQSFGDTLLVKGNVIVMSGITYPYNKLLFVYVFEGESSWQLRDVIIDETGCGFAFGWGVLLMDDGGLLISCGYNADLFYYEYSDTTNGYVLTQSIAIPEFNQMYGSLAGNGDEFVFIHDQSIQVFEKRNDGLWTREAVIVDPPYLPTIGINTIDISDRRVFVPTDGNVHLFLIGS